MQLKFIKKSKEDVETRVKSKLVKFKITRKTKENNKYIKYTVL